MKYIKRIIIAICMVMLTGCTVYDRQESVSPDEVSSNQTVEVTDSISQNTSYVDQSIIDNMAPATEITEISISQDILNRGIFNPGNTERLAGVMKKAASGEDITIAYIGGSITNGDAANPKATNCYAYLSYQWWVETFPNVNVEYVNAGIGGTDSYLGAHRVADQVLSTNPDLVIVEFSVNDGETINKETYESLLRAILLSENEPAVISLILTMQNMYDYSADHTSVAFNLKVPIVNFKAVLEAGVSNGEFTADKLYISDGVHPNNAGHQVIANCLTQLYVSVLSSINEMEYSGYTVPDNTLTKHRFENADIIYADEIESVSCNGFSVFSNPYYGLPNPNGWETTESGSISFEVEAASIGIIYIKTVDGLGGQFDVYVDGELNTLINANFSNGWGNAITYAVAYKSEEVATHLVEIVPNAESSGQNLTILGIAVAK